MPDVPSSEAEALARVESPKIWGKLTQTIECLCQPAWGNGVGKGERCLFTFFGTGEVRILIKVTNPALKLSVVGKSLDEAHAALELALRSSPVPWQRDERGNTPPKKSKK